MHLTKINTRVTAATIKIQNFFLSLQNPCLLFHFAFSFHIFPTLPQATNDLDYVHYIVFCLFSHFI